MPRGVKKFVLSWVINTLAVLIAVYIVSGIKYEKPSDLLVASLVLGIINAIVRPFILVLALPLLLVTLGFFLLVINALVLYFVGFLLRPHFYVGDFWSAFWGALIISIVTLVLNSLTGTGTSRIKVERRPASPKEDDDVIDV